MPCPSSGQNTFCQCSEPLTYQKVGAFGEAETWVGQRQAGGFEAGAKRGREVGDYWSVQGWEVAVGVILHHRAHEGANPAAVHSLQDGSGAAAHQGGGGTGGKVGGMERMRMADWAEGWWGGAPEGGWGVYCSEGVGSGKEKGRGLKGVGSGKQRGAD